jgi:hypothetical protein
MDHGADAGIATLAAVIGLKPDRRRRTERAKVATMLDEGLRIVKEFSLTSACGGEEHE